MAADPTSPVSPDEAAALFHDLQNLPALVLAVSGGPDSTALMLLAARWRKSLECGPKLLAVTVDHGLRAESKQEAKAVASLARKLGIVHRTLRWTGKKPVAGLQEAARAARYKLLADAAKRAGAPAVLTAHTLDDQAETVLIRLTRGSGLTGLAGMRRVSVIPGRSRSERTRNPDTSYELRSGFRVRAFGAPRNDGLLLVRPLLTIPKSRLIATLAAENIAFADDPSNRDRRFTRPRLRVLMPTLAEEGLDARRLARLAERVARAEEALGETGSRAFAELAKSDKGRITFPAADLMRLPAEISLRLLARAIGELGDEGPVELGKLEALHSALVEASRTRARFRRSLAGAVVTLNQASLSVERAPPRRSRRLTTVRTGRRERAKKR